MAPKRERGESDHSLGDYGAGGESTLWAFQDDESEEDAEDAEDDESEEGTDGTA